MFRQKTPRIVGFAGLLAMAVTTATIASADGQEVPLAKTMNDAGLQWGPCPPVFPAGCEIAVLHGNPANPNADVFFKVGLLAASKQEEVMGQTIVGPHNNQPSLNHSVSNQPIGNPYLVK